MAPDRPVRKQQQRSLRTQQKLIDAAVEAFAENGFKGTSTRDIAERAGVHHPLITYHFRSKEMLWHAAADKVWSSFAAEARTALAEAGDLAAGPQMAVLLRTYLGYVHQQPALHKLIAQESYAPNARLTWLAETHLAPFYEDLRRRVDALSAAGVTAPVDPALLAGALRITAGSLVALGLELQSTCGIDVDSDAGIDELASLLMQLFFPGLETPANP